MLHVRAYDDSNKDKDEYNDKDDDYIIICCISMELFAVFANYPMSCLIGH